MSCVLCAIYRFMGRGMAGFHWCCWSASYVSESVDGRESVSWALLGKITQKIKELEPKCRFFKLVNHIDEMNDLFSYRTHCWTLWSTVGGCWSTPERGCPGECCELLNRSMLSSYTGDDAVVVPSESFLKNQFQRLWKTKNEILFFGWLW